MKAEEAVEIDRGITAAARWRGNSDARAQSVVVRLAKGDDDVEAISGSALEEDDELLFAHGRSRSDGTLQKCGHGAQAGKGDAALLHKKAAGEFCRANAFTAAVAHRVTSIS